MSGPRRFIGYRPTPPHEYYEQGAANPPDKPQYEGVEFSDGTVVVRWLTEFRSHSVWADFDTFYRIHGHPEYGTIIKWLDLLPFCRMISAPSINDNLVAKPIMRYVNGKLVEFVSDSLKVGEEFTVYWSEEDKQWIREENPDLLPKAA